MSRDHIAKSLLEKLATVAPILSPEKRKKVAGELQTPIGFWTTQPEIEWAWFLLVANVPNVVVEPEFPNSGPDIAASLVSRPVQFEVKAPWGTDQDYKQIISSYDNICLAASQQCGEAASFHLHLTSAFVASDASAFHKQLVSLASRAARERCALTLVYQKHRSSILEGQWAPMLLVDNSFTHEGSWIRRNYYRLMPVATWRSWIDTFESYKHTPAPTATASFSIETLGMHSPPIRNASIGVTSEGRRQRWKDIRQRLKKTKRQQSHSPFVIIFDCAHLPNITEFDIIAAAFGEQYCLSLLLYAFGFEGGLQLEAATCPSHISALIIYYGPNFPTARLYRNPRATYLSRKTR